ncbi:MAG TPA: sigma-E processing peptidase SpoIIGA, partial [Clostridia bacterium]|nr:sigma-E processing peptidase SpoIIGA [Clostridia bacterium]
MPVIVAEYGTVEKLVPPMLRPAFKKGKIDHPDIFDDAGWKGRFRMIPFGSVGNSGGLLPAFRPDRIIVRGTGRETKISEILIAVSNGKLSSDGRYSVLLNTHLFRQ